MVVETIKADDSLHSQLQSLSLSHLSSIPFGLCPLTALKDSSKEFIWLLSALHAVIILRLPNLVYLGKLDERVPEWDGDARADVESVVWGSSVEVRGLEGGDIKSMGDRGGVPDDLLGDANGADVESLGESGTCCVLGG